MLNKKLIIYKYFKSIIIVFNNINVIKKTKLNFERNDKGFHYLKNLAIRFKEALKICW
jgi:hypothetical protein